MPAIVLALGRKEARIGTSSTPTPNRLSADTFPLHASAFAAALIHTVSSCLSISRQQLDNHELVLVANLTSTERLQVVHAALSLLGIPRVQFVDEHTAVRAAAANSCATVVDIGWTRTTISTPTVTVHADTGMADIASKHPHWPRIARAISLHEKPTGDILEGNDVIMPGADRMSAADSLFVPGDGMYSQTLNLHGPSEATY